MTILKKIKINVPNDIEEKIRLSQEFSKEIKNRCKISFGQIKNQDYIQNDKKLKMADLENLFE